jgi:phospholipase A1
VNCSRWKYVCATMAANLLLLNGAVSAEEPVTGPTTTLRERAAASASQEQSSLEGRLKRESETGAHDFVITPHRPNYILPLTYNTSVNREPYGPDGDELQQVEIKFQISFKAPVDEDIFGGNGDLFFAYTQLSFWQAYNRDVSAPFRETNYEPEAFLQFDTNVPVLGLRNRLLTFGIVHQSNGRSEPLSRSWNRVYAEFVLDRGRFAMSVKPWYRLKEPAETDDNPDINRYLGPGELRIAYDWKKYVAAVMLRCNFRPGNIYGAVQLEGSFPLTKKLKGYVQYFYGYGETLIDYNARTSRIGIGILLTDWL